MPRLCCNTSSFRRQSYANRWDQARLFQAVADSKVDAAIVEDRVFNERAMWWTRVGKEHLAKAGVELVAIGTRIGLLETASDRFEEQIANLMEWGRIAALSGIPYVGVDVEGPDIADWSVTESALRRAAEYVSRYGTLFILTRTYESDDAKMLRLARALGYRRCRLGIAHRSPIEPELRPWVAQVTVHSYARIPAADPFLVCIEPEGKDEAVAEIQAIVASMRRTG